MLDASLRSAINEGMVIPASPLALTADRHFDPTRQRALMRYYIDAGAGGIAVGMHFTQFAIRRPGIDLYEPVLRCCAEAIDAWDARRGSRTLKVAGIEGPLDSALEQAQLAKELGYDIAIVSLASRKGALPREMVHHVAAVAQILPVFGFYLLTGVGGINLPYRFWREVIEIPDLVGIKIAPFTRYGTIDVVRAVCESDRCDDIALYTGNDDSIVYDLMTPYRFGGKEKRIVGGLLGQWACWTKRAVELQQRCRQLQRQGAGCDADLLARSAAITDANAALFDPGHGYAGSIPGVNEILRRQGIFAGIETLDPDEVLAPGQAAEIDRVCAAYPEIQDNAFVAEHLDEWLTAPDAVPVNAG